MSKQQYKQAKLFSSTHTLKVVFNIGHWSVLDNLAHMDVCCGNIFIIILQESIMNLLSFLYGLEGLLYPFFLSFKYKDILIKTTNSVSECAFLFME